MMFDAQRALLFCFLLRQMGIDYLHSFLQPWVKHDMRSVLREPDIVAVRAGKYISMHVRRTDKQVYNEAQKTETVVRSAVACLANSDALK